MTTTLRLVNHSDKLNYQICYIESNCNELFLYKYTFAHVSFHFCVTVYVYCFTFPIQLNRAADDATVNTIVADKLEIRFACGYTKPVVQLKDIPDLTEAVARHSILQVNQSCMDQLKEGLKTLGFLECLQANPNVFKSLFVRNKETNMTGEMIKKLFKVKYSAKNSNRFHMETCISANLMEFMDDLDGGSDFQLNF